MRFRYCNSEKVVKKKDLIQTGNKDIYVKAVAEPL